MAIRIPLPARLGALAFLVVVSAPSRAAASAPPVVEAAACRVTLTKLSYDDPDADDAEFLELHVERKSPLPTTAPVVGAVSAAPSALPPCGPPPAPDAAAADAAPSADSSVARRLTLGDCGLEAVALVNGASGACETYRTIALADAPVPDDDFVVVCAVDSTPNAAGACDVTAAGRSALKNGWLQNGPGDGIALVKKDGSRIELGYEGGPACFASAATLPEESGAIAGADGDPVDDVAALCDGAFVLLPADRAELRHAASCPEAKAAGATPDAGAVPSSGAGGAPAGGVGADARAPWMPEFAPGAPAVTPTAEVFPALADAGAAALRGAAGAPRPPSCSTASPGMSNELSRLGSSFMLLLGVNALVRWHRKRRMG